MRQFTSLFIVLKETFLEFLIWMTKILGLDALKRLKAGKYQGSLQI